MTFYSWKYVRREANQIHETIVLQSPQWFQHRQQCIEDAEKRVPNEDKQLKRVITRKLKTIDVLDGEKTTDVTDHMLSLLKLCYTLQLCKIWNVSLVNSVSVVCLNRVNTIPVRTYRILTKYISV